MISDTTSPVKKKSVAIPPSMHKLIAELQRPKKNKKPINLLPLKHKRTKKSKLDTLSTDLTIRLTHEKEFNNDKLEETVPECPSTTDISEVSYSPRRHSDNIDNLQQNSDQYFYDDNFEFSVKENDNLIVSSNEKTFTYPQIEISNKCGTSEAMFQEPDNNIPNFDIFQNEKDHVKTQHSSVQDRELKSAIRTPNSKRINNKKWVTFNDILQSKTESANFVDHLYGDEPKDGTNFQQIKENKIPYLKNEVELQPKNDDTDTKLMDAIRLVREMNDMITNARNEISKFQYVHKE